MNFSDTFSAATAVQTGVPGSQASVSGIPAGVVEAVCAAAPLPPSPAPSGQDGSILFDLDKLRDAVTHANDMTLEYGVKVLSINIISARPADMHLMNALAKGAVAAAEAQQFETAAKGKARAARIEAQGTAQANVIAAEGDAQALMVKTQGEADSLKVSAQADADAQITRAGGSLEAANRLRQNEVAVTLATIHEQGRALGGAKSSLILGSDPKGMGSLLLANPSIVPQQ